MAEALFPAVEPFAVDSLDVPGGHRLRYEQCGNPTGVPVVFLHGGPGSSINPGHRRFFDPAFYRAVLYDQRGCGQSTPRGGVDANTTQWLVDDLERLRSHLGMRRWLLFGGSWGATLALAYAQAHPEAVSGCILRGPFLGTDAEVEWFLTGLKRFLPEAWESFTRGASELTAAGVLRHYQSAIADEDGIAVEAAARWASWESALMAIGEAASASSASTDSRAILDRVRVQLHYLTHSCFLSPNQLMNGVPALKAIPAILLQGRRDLICPPETAHRIHRAWDGAQLRMIDEAGHSAMHPHLACALVQALNDIRPKLTER
jgi:proline iminopeptidase